MHRDDDPPQSDETDLGALFLALSHVHRRRVLQCLWEHGTELTLADVAEEVTAQQTETSIQNIEPETVTRTYLSLYHQHIPQLEEADLVSYDQENDLVIATSERETVRSAVDTFLDPTATHSPDG
ncbi:helix-turn-helix domain-containing protein [Halorientalis brevis]|uniref:Helix-turn-helix domain-containing protein n=1 Tax=Halorientalis brevis TaxID=1126241 RepID=A0ABD6CA62_9EURY|nr:helix-turn-helix domain-containing protein [Halorientalis brevis]